MSTQKLERAYWKRFCERVSRGLAVQRTHIEVSSPEVGVEFDARWLPLTGMTYDPRRDVLDIAIEEQGHLILCPHELYVEISARGLECLCVLESDNVWQVILLRAPLVLPPSPHDVQVEYEARCTLRESTPQTRASGES